MRAIIKDILASPVPVATFVSPEGARAASAGAYILYASHVAAMAPATNLGAATPVAIGIGGKPEADSSKKVPESPESAAKPLAGSDAMTAKSVADASAYIRSLAQLRGRNAEFAERAVREAASLSAAEALENKVIDLVAVDLPELLARLDGRPVALGSGTVTLATAKARIERLDTNWRNRFLAVITTQQIALILMIPVARPAGPGVRGRSRARTARRPRLQCRPDRRARRRWKVSARLARTAYRWGAHSDETRWTLAQHYTLNRDLAVRAAWSQFGEIRESSVGVLVYF